MLAFFTQSEFASCQFAGWIRAQLFQSDMPSSDCQKKKKPFFFFFFLAIHLSQFYTKLKNIAIKAAGTANKELPEGNWKKALRKSVPVKCLAYVGL